MRLMKGVLSKGCASAKASLSSDYLNTTHEVTGRAVHHDGTRLTFLLLLRCVLI